MVVLAVIIAGALSFFILWSTRSAESFRYKAADEASANAVRLITADIRKAGFGVTGNPEYAVFVVNNGTTNADELYLSCGDYLNLEGDIRAPTSDTVSVPYRSINSVFKQKRTFTVASVPLSYQGMITLDTASNFILRAVPTIEDAAIYSNIGAVITDTPAAVDVDINATTFVPGQIPGTRDWTLPLAPPARNATGGSAALTAGMTVAPAISYKVIPSTDQSIGGSLWRNRGRETSPYGTEIMGGTPSVNVTGFQVRCQYLDTATGTSQWVDTNVDPTNIKVVEVTISYRIRISKAYKVDSSTKIYGWGSEVRRSFRVAPRSIVIASQM